jgi:hypothetical protein
MMTISRLPLIARHATPSAEAILAGHTALAARRFAGDLHEHIVEAIYERGGVHR